MTTLAEPVNATTAFAEPAKNATTAFAEPAKNATAFAEPAQNVTSLAQPVNSTATASLASERPKSKKIIDDFINEFAGSEKKAKADIQKDDIHQMNQNEDNEILDSIATAEKMLHTKMGTP